MFSKSKIFIAGAVCFLIYLAFCLPAIRQPLLGDSVMFPSYARGFYHSQRLDPYFAKDLFFSPGVWHPPFYMSMLALLGGFTALNETSARFIGIACFALTLLLIYRLTTLVFGYSQRKRIIALSAVFLYSLNPMAIQGSLLPDIDTSVMVPLMLGFVYLFFRLKDKKAGPAILGICFAVLLWAKLTTPFLLILAIAGFYGLQGRIKEGLIKSGVICLTGVMLFLVSWAGFSHFLHKPFIYPFNFIQNTLIQKTLLSHDIRSFGVILSVLRVSVRLFFYLTPFYCAVYVLSLNPGSRKPGAVDGQYFLRILTLLILACYFLAGRLTYSFPKYHYPFIAFSTILVCGLLTQKLKLERKYAWFYLSAVTGIVLYNILAAGDLLDLTDYRLKENIIVNGFLSPGLARELTLRITFYLAPFILLAGWFWLRKKKVILWNMVFLWLAASFISQDILQAKAGYSTVYCYGVRKTRQFLGALDQITAEGGDILTSDDIYYNINNANKPFAACFQANDYLNAGNFISTVKKQAPRAIAFGLSANTIEQYRDVFESPETIGFLKGAGYRKSVLGSYTIWEK